MKTTKADSFGGRFRGLPDQVPAQPALGGAEDERAGGAHRAAFGRRCDADEDGAEHQEDQEQRRHHHKRGLLRHRGEEAESGELVDDPVHDSSEEREQDAEEHAEHDVVGAVGFGVSHHEPAEHATGDEEHQQRPQAAAAVLLAEAERIRRQARSGLGKDQCDKKCIQGIKAGEHQSRNEGALIHVADRLAELVGHHDQHQRRRDDLRQRARGGDDAGRHPAVVAVAQHDRQRDQAHRDHGRRHHAGGRRQQRADEDDGVGKAAADGAEQLADGVEQILRHAGSLQHQAHEGEERDREQGVVVHHAVDAFGQRLQEVRPEFAKLNADQGVDQADCAE